MLRIHTLAVILLALGPVAAQDYPLVVKEDPLSPQDQAKKFHLPPGFEIQLVASEPEIIKPMNLAFDDRGRLFVTQSVEYPFPAKDAAKARDTVKMLEDFGPDGRARKISTYLDGLNIPIGVTAVQGGLLAYSIPKIYRCPDADGDGVADSREAIYGDAASDDTHGMLSSFTPWLDGWIYATHGFRNRSTLKGSDGHAITMSSGNTFRFRADGTRVEQYSHGQVNPFGLAFDPLGNVFTSDCHSMPAYQNLRGGFYPTFGGEHDGLGHAPAIMSHNHGSTGICGVLYYSSDQFPAPWRDTLMICNPITHRINLDVLERHGSSVKALERPDFIKCDDPWFRPVHQTIAPDGTVYIADFYSCIIGHYEVDLNHPKREKRHGRIWRVVYTGEGAQAPRSMADLTKAKTGDLLALLKDPTLTVRVRAVNQLVERIGREAVEPVRALVLGGGDALQKAHGLWVLERLGALDEGLLAKLAADPDRMVRVHALKVVAERKAWTFEAGLAREKLKDEDAFVRRAAAEGIALHPARENVKPLLDLWEATPKDDTHLMYTARKALRDQFLVPGVLDSVAGLPDKESRRVAEVCLGARDAVSARHLLSWLKGSSPDAGTISTYLHHVIRYSDAGDLGAAVDYARSLAKRPVRDQAAALKAIQKAMQERGAKVPAEVLDWALATVKISIGGQDRGAAIEALALARDLKLQGVAGDVAGLLETSKSDGLRGACIDTLPHLDGGKALPALSKVISNEAEKPEVRLRACTALGMLNTPEARTRLVDLLKTTPSQLALPIASGLAGTREGSEALLVAVAEGRTSPRVLLDKGVNGRLKASKVPQVDERVRKLTSEIPPEDERLKKLVESRRAGFAKAKPDLTRGAEVFTKACAGCHKVGGKGNKIGPELDGVGNRGLDRILEDVLDPNRNVDHAFRATLIKAKDGRVISGLVLREEGQVVVIAEAADKETRISAGDIEERKLSQLSPMPTNVTEALPEPDFYDLVAWLLSQRPAK